MGKLALFVCDVCDRKNTLDFDIAKEDEDAVPEGWSYCACGAINCHECAPNVSCPARGCESLDLCTECAESWALTSQRCGSCDSVVCGIEGQECAYPCRVCKLVICRDCAVEEYVDETFICRGCEL
jgi:hypothetical protein